MKAFLIDLTICNGCYNCQIVCKDEHVGNDWTPIAKPEPDTGQFWLKIDYFVRGTQPKVKVAYIPMPCMHCDNATCIGACPVAAIYRRSDGLVIIDPVKCIGCQLCLDTKACAYRVIYFNTDLNIAQKCTGCAHLLDNGWTETRCSDACPTTALKFGEDSSFNFTGTEILHPEYNLQSRVHYKALPKKFIAGTVFDSKADEVVIGATCTLSGAGTASTTTDAFGDFWFEGLPQGTFSLQIAATGHTTKTIPSINTTTADVNLGDIDLA
jgi:Fe-S-cluster-containing dehydrogenase component